MRMRTTSDDIRPRLFLTVLTLLVAATLAALVVAWPAAAGSQPLAPDTQPPRPGPQLLSVGQVDVGGWAYAVAVQGDHAYVGAGNRLVVVDVSDPTAPQVVGQTASFSDSVATISVTGTHAYLAAGEAGLRVVDISDPAAPQEVGSFTMPNSRIHYVDVVGDYAYVANYTWLPGTPQFRVLDVSSPAMPHEVGNTFVRADSIDVVGDYAYVTVSSMLQVIDVSNPFSPTVVGHYDASPVYLYIVSVEGHFAYVNWHYCSGYRTCSTGVYVIDVSHPRTPTKVGEVGFGPSGGGYPVDLYVTDTLVYATTMPSYFDAEILGIRAIDVAHPTSPSVVAYDFNGPYGGEVRAKGEYVYVAGVGWYDHGYLTILRGPPCITATGLQAMSADWRLSIGDSGYDRDYDRDGDYTITVLDIMDVARWWQESCR